MMNKRIPELEQQTWKEVAKLGTVRYRDWIQKYTELVVMECIRCCDDIDAVQQHYLKYHIDQQLGASECISVIKKHFEIDR